MSTIPAEADGRPAAAGRRWLPATWWWLVPVVQAVVLVGPSLLGVTVLLPTDVQEGFEPWRSVGEPVEVANPALRDQLDTYDPEQLTIWRRIVSPGDPGWLREAGMGSPGWWFAGNGSLSPYTVVMVSAGGAGPGLAAALRVVMAGLGAGLLARAYGRSQAGAAVAAGAFATSGFMVAWLGWPQAHVASWICWVWWGVVRTARRDAPWWSVAALAAVVAAAWLGGFPAVALLLCLTATGLAAAEAFGGGDRWAGLLRAWGGLAAGTLLAALQLLPTLSYLGAVDTSARAELWRGSLPSHLLVRWFAPGFFGDGVDVPYWGRINEVETAAAIGVPALVLAILGVAWRLRDGRVARLVGLAVVTGGLAYGLPGLDLLQRAVPGLRTNPPARSLVLAAAALAVLAAFGVDWIRASDRRLDRVGLAALGVAAAAAVMIVVALRPDLELAALLDQRRPPGSPARAEAVATMWRAAVGGVVLAGATAAAIWTAGRRRPAGPLALAGLVALAATVPLATGWGFNTQRPPETRYPPVADLAALADLPGDARVAGPPGTLLPMTNLLYGFDDARGRRFTTAAQRRLVEAAGGVFASPTRWDLSADPSEWTAALGALGVTHVVTPRDSPPPTVGGPVAVDQVVALAHLRVVPVVGTAPPVSATADVVELPAEEALAWLRERTDPTRVVLAPGTLALPPEPRPATVRESRRDGRSVTIAIDAPDGAVVRLIEPDLPGWTATVDGVPVPVVTADVAWIGVAVPPGGREVVLRWRPPGLFTGVLLVVVAAAATVAWTVVAWRRERRRPRRPLSAGRAR